MLTAWIGRALLWLGKAATLTAVVTWILDKVGAAFGYVVGLMAYVYPPAGDFIIKKLNEKIVAPYESAVILAADTLHAIAGIEVNTDSLRNMARQPPSRAGVSLVGETFTRLVTDIFSTEAAQKDFQGRTGSGGSIQNLNAFFGMNLTFQLRSLVIGTMASITGWGSLRHLEGLHQTINWAFGFGWLSWAVMSEYMNITVNPGVRRQRNSLVQTNDYTDTEARWAVWAGHITRGAHDTIMDNLGVRRDIRDSLLERAEADLTDTELKKLFKKKRLSEADIIKMYRQKGYGETRAKLKFALFTEEDVDDTLDKIADAYLALYRDCVITRGELEVALQNLGWKQEQINSNVALAELQRRQRKWLSNGDMAELFNANLMDMDEIYDLLVCQGMTGVDATLALTAMVKFDKLPKHIKDCFDKIKPIDFGKGFAQLLALLAAQGFLLPSQLLAFIKCFGLADIIPLAEVSAIEAAPAARLPSGSFNALPSSPDDGEQFRLVWNIQNASTVKIDNGIGAVANQGTQFLAARTNTVWHLTATNEDGVRTFQASILVKPKPAPRPVALPMPGVTLSVSPASVTEGEQYVLQWETRFATQVFLSDGGPPQPVALSGAQFRVADKSRIFTITAAGSGGQRSRSDTQIVRAQDPTLVQPPHASLSVSPGHATVGDRVEIKWSTSNAATVSLEGLAGTENVPPSGVRVFTADHDRIVKLYAFGPDSTVSRVALDALIVDPPPPADEPTVPRPSVSLTVRPTRANRGQVVAIEWRTNGAERVTLQRNSGLLELEQVGAMEIEAVETEPLILRAEGPGGSSAIAKLLHVVQPRGFTGCSRVRAVQTTGRRAGRKELVRPIRLATNRAEWKRFLPGPNGSPVCSPARE